MPGNTEVSKLGQPSHAFSPVNIVVISAMQCNCVLNLRFNYSPGCQVTTRAGRWDTLQAARRG